jgi:hypothetical protein
MLQTQAGSDQGKGGAQVYYGPLLHDRDGLNSVTLRSLLEDTLENFVDADGRHDQLFGIFNGGREEICVRPIGEVFKPAG